MENLPNGTVVGQHRNTIGMFVAPMSFICYFLYKEEDFKFGKLLTIFLIFLVIICGSRTTMLQTIILFALYLMNKKSSLQGKIKGIIISIICIVTVYTLLVNVPYLRDTFYERTKNMIAVYTGEEYADKSTIGRKLLQQLGWTMLREKPLLGYGIDGFHAYLASMNATIDGYKFPNASYSHCNYTELAANFGIMGLVIWYWLVAYMLIESFKNRHKDKYIKLAFVLIFSMILMDPSRINFSSQFSIDMYLTVFCIFRVYMENINKEKRKLNETKKNTE